jgi:hypothetical protein
MVRVHSAKVVSRVMRVSSDRLESLASPAFIASLALLVINDFALKPLLHNALTGKLSDFAGLFALTLFVATLWPRHARRGAALIALAFTFWKTSYAEPLIEAWNAVAPLAFGRTVDLTDLVALPMIPFAIWAAPRLEPWRLPRALQVSLAILAPLAFTATSQPSQLVRSTLDVSSVPAIDASALQAFFDQVAEDHGLRCSVCDPLAAGRVYLSDDSRGKGARDLSVNLDAEQGRLFYETSAVGSQRNLQDALAISAEIRSGLQERFPGVTAIEFESGAGRSLARNITTFTIQMSTESGLTETVEQARRTLAPIVEEVVRTHGLRPQEDGPLYYAGDRYGTSGYDRDLVLESYSSRNATSTVRVMRQTDNYAALYDAITKDLAERLVAAFGSAAVARKDYPGD